MIDFKVGNEFFTETFNIGYKENEQEKSKIIKVSISQEESQKLKEIFSKLEEENKEREKILKKITEQNRIIDLTKQKEELKQELEELHKLEKVLEEYDEETNQKTKKINNEIGNIFFKEENDFLKRIMPEFEYDRLVSEMGLDLIKYLINQNQNKYTNITQH